MTTELSRPAADEYAPYYAGYIREVADTEDVVGVLDRQREELAGLLRGLTAERARYRYAPGKWSVTEIVGHLADAERVFAYRALRIARGDETPLAGFDEDAFVAAAGFDDRSLGDVLAEYEHVRRSTIALFRGFRSDVWTRRGTANGHPVSVRALPYIIAGHERHHGDVLRARYGL